MLSLQARKPQNPNIHKYHPSFPFLKPQTKKEPKGHCNCGVLFSSPKDWPKAKDKGRKALYFFIESSPGIHFFFTYQCYLIFG